jgi:heat shock protein HslJ
MTPRIRTLAALAVILATMLALVACSKGSALDGTSWRLTGWSVSSIDPAQVTITARFAAGRIAGSGGVNSYGGPYRAGPGDVFEAGPFTSTLMAGPEPAMRAEAAFLTLLGQAASYTLHTDTLILYDEGGNQSLIFTRAE